MPRRFAPPGSGPSSSSFGRELALGCTLFLVVFAAVFAFVRAMPVLYDTDSYAHLGLALVYQEEGLVRDLSSVRFSAMSDGFGDKDLLFHLLLSRFVRPGESAGGRLALALLAAAIVTLVSLLAARAAGRWGLLAGPLLLLLAQDVPDRLLRLRPELGGLLVLLLATASAAGRRYRTLGALSLLLVLAYNVAQLLVVLVAGWAAIRWWRRERWEWEGVLYPLLGLGLGLVLHPHFPKNLEIWYQITFEHLARVDEFPEGGAELLSARTIDVVRNNFWWWIALGALASSITAVPGRRSAGDLPPGHEAGCYTIAAAAFAALYFGAMGRFGVYFYPFATLALLHEVRQRGLRFGFWSPAAGPLRAPTAVLLGATALCAAGPSLRMARFFLDDRAPGPPREVEWRAFGAAVPEGAKVAAPWGETGAYLFWAPRGRYLNILDPLFMADSHPAQFVAQRSLFAGESPDVPFVLGRWLDSDHLAFSRFLAAPRLQARCAADPRLERVYSGYNLLYRLRPGQNRSFWLDWEHRPAEPAPAPAAETGWSAYPRAPGALDGIEGFVDAHRVAVPGRCVRFRHRFELAAAERLRLEFAPYGPGRLAVDGEPRVELAATTGAVLGQGALATVELAPGPHLAEVESCPGTGAAWNGFYLRTLTSP